MKKVKIPYKKLVELDKKEQIHKGDAKVSVDYFEYKKLLEIKEGLERGDNVLKIGFWLHRDYCEIIKVQTYDETIDRLNNIIIKKDEEFKTLLEEKTKELETSYKDLFSKQNELDNLYVSNIFQYLRWKRNFK